MTKPLVVLDKDFLVAVSTADFEQLATRYGFLATDGLIGECFQYVGKDDLKKHTQSVAALKKFSGKEHLLRRVDDVQFHLNQEIETRLPCWPLEDYVNSSIYFNKTHLETPTLLLPIHDEAIKRWQRYVSSEVRSQILRCAILTSPVFNSDLEFKRLKERPAASEEQVKSYAQQRLPQIREFVGRSVEFVRSIYSSFRPFGHPLPEKIDQRWFLFRKCQVEALMHLDLVELVMQSGSLPSNTNLAHDVLDYTYCLFGAHAGALASNEKAQRKRFRLLCPAGTLLSKNPQSGQVESETGA